ncbi:MAG: hypothetical protein PHX78_04200 [bacterium]|nr:hypothetical protein [bacterium]
MKKECCNVKVNEIDNGYQIEITGEEVKEKCKTAIENCCKDGKSCGEFFKKFCS